MFCWDTKCNKGRVILVKNSFAEKIKFTSGSKCYKMTRNTMQFHWLLLLLSSLGFAQSNYYVSPSLGSDTNNGQTIENPFKTIAKAVAEMDKTDGGTCFLLEGNYEESSIELDGYKNLIFQAHNNAMVVLNGTREISNIGWTGIGNNIYAKQLTLGSHIWQLFIDDKEQVMARWPNAQFYDDSVYDKTYWAHGVDGMENGTMKDNGALAQSGLSDTDLVGALAIANIGSFRTWVVPVESANVAANTFTYEQVSANGYRDNHQDYFLEGKRALLDVENEWYYNMDTQMLYVYGDPSGKEIRGKVQDYLFEMQDVAHVTFEGLRFFGTSVKAQQSNNITINNCYFSYPSCSRRMLGDTSYPKVTELSNGTKSISSFTLYKCVFEYTDGEAFFLEGGNNTIEDCYIHHIDYSCGSLRNLGTTLANKGDNCVFKNNTIFTTGASSTLALGSFPIVSYNDISHTGLLQNDGSMIQITKNAVDGSEVHHNWLHHSIKSGMRYDAPGDDPTVAGHFGLVHHNVIWATGKALMIKGDNQEVYNNTCFDNSSVSITILDEEGSNLSTKTINNLADRISGERNDAVTIPGVVTNNVYSDTTTPYGVRELLVDPDHFDFRPKPSASEVIDMGAVIEGITTSNSPDIGAYEVDDTWVAGVTWTPDLYPWGEPDVSVLKIENGQATEGETIKLKLSLDKPNASDTTIQFSISNNTTQDEDYIVPNLVITIPANTLATEIKIETVDDLLVESDEVLEITLLTVSTANAIFLNTIATGTIKDNDIPSPTDRNGFVLNPTFEQQFEGGFDHWEYSGNGGSASPSSDISVTNSGQSSIKIVVNSTGSQGSVKLRGTPFTFEGNGTDAISVSVFMDIKVETVVPSKRIKMMVKDAVENGLSKTNQITELSTTWQTVKMNTSFPAANSYELYLDLGFGEYPSTIYIDHIRSTVSGGAVLSGNEPPILNVENVSEVSNQNKIHCYPNPVANTLHIQTNGNRLLNCVELFSQLGTSLIKKELTRQNEILNLEGLPTGIYYARILFSDGASNVVHIQKK